MGEMLAEILLWPVALLLALVFWGAMGKALARGMKGGATIYGVLKVPTPCKEGR